MSKAKIISIVTVIILAIGAIVPFSIYLYNKNKGDDKLSSQQVLRITYNQLDNFFSTMMSEDNKVEGIAASSLDIDDYNEGLTDNVAYTFMDYCIDNVSGDMSLFKTISEFPNIQEGKAYEIVTYFGNDKYVYTGMITKVNDNLVKLTIQLLCTDIAKAENDDDVIVLSDYYIEHDNSKVISYTLMEYEKHIQYKNYGAEIEQYYYYANETKFNFNTKETSYSVLGYFKNEDLTFEQFRNEIINFSESDIEYVNNYVSYAKGTYSEGNVIYANDIDGFHYLYNAEDVTVDVVNAVKNSWKYLNVKCVEMPAETETIESKDIKVWTKSSGEYGKDAQGNYYLYWIDNRNGNSVGYYLIVNSEE